MIRVIPGLNAWARGNCVRASNRHTLAPLQELTVARFASELAFVDDDGAA